MQAQDERDGFDSPEDAAMFGFPPRYCRVVASRRQGDSAYVLLDTGSDGNSYLYGASCHLSDGRWHEFSSGNMPGWTVTDGDEDVGMLSFWGEAPTGADRVRVEFDGALHEEPVEHGAWLCVWWEQPGEGHPRPRVEAFRIGGVWRSR